jgi:hypothetical protein
MTGEEYDALHAEAEALRDQNRDLRIEAEGWFSRVNGVEAKLEELRAQHSGLSERHDVLSLALNEVAGELEAARGLLERVTTSFVAGALAQRYPKPSLLKDCNVSYSNSSRPLAEQGERQEAVAWALANSADEIGGFAPIYYTKEGAISWANGRNIFPLYTTPQPGQDVRGLAAFFIELFDGALDGGSFDGGDIQDAGVRHGLLIVEQREESCGEHCACAEYGFPVDCYRLAPALAAHRQEQRKASEQ